MRKFRKTWVSRRGRIAAGTGTLPIDEAAEVLGMTVDKLNVVAAQWEDLHGSNREWHHVRDSKGETLAVDFIPVDELENDDLFWMIKEYVDWYDKQKRNLKRKLNKLVKDGVIGKDRVRYHFNLESAKIEGNEPVELRLKVKKALEESFDAYLPDDLSVDEMFTMIQQGNY